MIGWIASPGATIVTPRRIGGLDAFRIGRLFITARLRRNLGMLKGYRVVAYALGREAIIMPPGEERGG
jgi:hypothetical protein